MLPLQGHVAPLPIQRQQMDLSKPRRKRIWQSIVRAKIYQQSSVLRDFNGEDAGLSALTKRVLSGDTSNVEARAALRYWPRLFGRDFRRVRSAPGINALLNYGYAIVRASVARAIVSAGLLPSVGIHHHHRSNAFSLADDLIEPFRPFVDRVVKRISVQEISRNAPLSLDDRQLRSQLLELLNERVFIGTIRTPLGLAVGMTTTSLVRCISDSSEKLLLPVPPDQRNRRKTEPLAASSTHRANRKTA